MIYITGDMHGDYDRFNAPQLKNLKAGDTLIICGDFGFIWKNTRKENSILKKIGKKKYNVCFIDGTHENFELLNECGVSEWKGGKVHHICGNLYHLMRGQVFRLEGLKIFTMGGGECSDFEMRPDTDTLATLAIPSTKELLEGAENMERCNNKVNIIISHEPPLAIKSFLSLNDNIGVDVTGLNTYFEELNNYCTFDRWFFGSMHEDKYISASHIAVFQKIVDAETGKPVR